MIKLGVGDLVLGSYKPLIMTEIFFYHMTESRLDQTLPGLLERCLERGWNVVIQTSSEERRDALDVHLWTFRDDAFLPHAAQGGTGDAAVQPIWITSEPDNPNVAAIRFLVDGASHDDLGSYTRAIYMFDGHDSDAVAHARTRWKAEGEAGHELTYWQQGDGGRWEKKA